MGKLRVTQEKELLIGLIVSDDFIKQIAPILQISYLQASSSKIIASWCLEYYDSYSQAPKELVQDIYASHKSTIGDDDAEIIAKVLQHISSMYEEKDKYNIPYMIGKARDYIRERKILTLSEALESDVTSKRLDNAENLILAYNRISEVERKVTNLWDDKQLTHNIFDVEYNDTFKLPGVLGEMIGGFKRGNLYSFAGVAKRGKTRWLAQLATISALQGENTVLFELEMNDEEIGDILLNNLVRKPKYDMTIPMPYFDEENAIGYRNTEFKGATEKDYEHWRKKGSLLCAPLHKIVRNPSEAPLDSLEDALLGLEYTYGFTPSTIIIDYADIIAGKGYDARDRVNNIWLGLKNLAKKFHCTVITATHMNGEALKKDADAVNVAEDKRKLNHVSGMYILNQTEVEKSAGVMRIKPTATRFGMYTSLDEVVVLYNFSVGRTYIDSRWRKDVPNLDAL